MALWNTSTHTGLSSISTKCFYPVNEQTEPFFKMCHSTHIYIKKEVCFWLGRLKRYAKLTLYALKKGADINHSGSCLHTGACICAFVWMPSHPVGVGVWLQLQTDDSGRRFSRCFRGYFSFSRGERAHALSALAYRFINNTCRVPGEGKSSCDHLFTWGYYEYASAGVPSKKWARTIGSVCVFLLLWVLSADTHTPAIEQRDLKKS